MQNRAVGTAGTQSAIKAYSLPITLPKGTWMFSATAGSATGATSGTILSCYIAVVYTVSTNIPAKQENTNSYSPAINSLTNILNCSGIIESTGSGATPFGQYLSYTGVGTVFGTKPSDTWVWRFIRVG